MKLLVDIGNTRSKAVLSDNGKLTPISYHLDLFEQFDIKQLTYASVRHDEAAISLEAKARKVGASLTQVKTSSEAFGVKCAYEKYQTLGIDRWLAVLGAVHEFPNQNVIVVDAGTATTVDFVHSNKVHEGGWIIPGLELMTSSIAEKADKVFDDIDTDYRYGLGKATPEALKFGCLAAQLGVVRQAVEYFGQATKLVITGGTASLMLKPLADLNPHHDDLIVFKGLDLF
ncbi:MAG: type III pantothenate kinase [Psychrosphaera sp.]|nr:type III pantothenate kinase [Psychrosphaera sp.]